ncbi:MAG TPA: response regulator [Gemmatimonadales bacterium]|nr:response regulator [Gemmatimonadales bacterium]
MDRLAPVQSNARILVVDDSPEVRRALLQVLLRSGYYRAETARDTLDAARQLALWGGGELLLIDVTLTGDPTPNGCRAAAALVRHWAGLRVLFLSGYDALDLRDLCPPDIPFLRKPASVPLILARVAAVLAAPPWIPPEDL